MSKICTFFGHRYVSLSKEQEEKLKQIIIDLIQNHNVTNFWVGGMGDFDSIASKTIRNLKKDFPHIKLEYALAYIPTNKENYEDLKRHYDSVFCPQGIELGPPRFAICRRNKTMVLETDFLIFYVKTNFGGAYQALKIAKRNNKTFFNIAEE